MNSRTAHAGVWLAYAWLALGSGEAAAQGTIHFVQPPEPIYVTQGRYDSDFNWQELIDLNADGIADYRFFGDVFSVSVQALGENGHLSLLATPPDLGSLLYPLPAEVSIGPSPPEGLDWVNSLTPSHPFAGTSGISAFTSNGGSGLFFGLTAYMGVQFLSVDGTHFGWVRIDAPSFEAGGVILDWAYETRSNVPILAGAVPEPSTWALIVLGGIFIAYARNIQRNG